ncbi:hypothetical protein N7495_009318 [Penicillium taxi]|uniref:uncharacterized protein n=1 Tax=Penicillium taxi TaxID=168475 RepID=UPI002544E380|nr:uncharacterized protein N7495_009318 [Penicillium taxi]KAJ5884808.1 hypothetical protein N7495_009318 [Penicillium taxi]
MATSSLKPVAAFQSKKATKYLSGFKADLEALLHQAMKYTSYRKTSVFALHWSNDDMGYGFETTAFEIPHLAQSPEYELLTKLMDWSKKNGGENTLRIIIYSGLADDAEQVLG